MKLLALALLLGVIAAAHKDDGLIDALTTKSW